MVDWSKPLQFEHGLPCELLDSVPGSETCAAHHRVVRRLSVGKAALVDRGTAIWYVDEDGSTGWPGIRIVNVKS